MADPEPDPVEPLPVPVVPPVVPEPVEPPVVPELVEESVPVEPSVDPSVLESVEESVPVGRVESVPSLDRGCGVLGVWNHSTVECPAAVILIGRRRMIYRATALRDQHDDAGPVTAGEQAGYQRDDNGGALSMPVH